MCRYALRCLSWAPANPLRLLPRMWLVFSTTKEVTLKSAIIALGLLFALVASAITTASAAEPFDIQVIVPLTGGAAFLGKGQMDMLNILAETVNESGGIKGRPVHFVFHDDQTSPQVAVQLANEILATKPAAILGSSILAMCAAMAPLMKNGPVQYCMSPSELTSAGKFFFSAGTSPFNQTVAVIRYFRLKGWTKIATLNTIDATGQSVDHALDEVAALPENKTITLVAREHFSPGDLSVAGQLSRIKAAGAQAIFAGVTGAPAATILKGMAQAGLDIPVSPTGGNQVFTTMQQWKDFLPNGLMMASSVFPEHAGVWKLDPRVEAAQRQMYAALAKHGLKADNSVATSWDPGLIVISAFKALGTDATADQIQNYIANLTNFAGIDGIYNFKAHTLRGLGPDTTILVSYDAQRSAWVWLTKPGGEPLK